MKTRCTKTRSAGRPPAEFAAAKLDDILLASIRMFAEKGYDGASVAELNRQLGVSHNLLYQRFGSKEKLWYATVDWAFQEVGAEIRQELRNATGGPLEQTHRILVRFIHANARRPEIVRLAMVEGVATTPRMSYMLQKHIVPLLTEATEPLRQLVADGVVPAIPLRTLYSLVVIGGTAVFSLPGMILPLGDKDPLDPQAVAEHANLVADMLISGLINMRAR